MTLVVLELEVAVTPPFEPVFEIVGRQPRYEAPWDELPRVIVGIEPSRSLRDAMRVACDELGVRLTADAIAANARYQQDAGLSPASSHAADMLVYVDFWRAGDDDIVDATVDPPILGRHTRRPAIDVVVRDSSGRAVWRKPGLDARLGELVDAATVGLIDGDPLRAYLHPSMPQGDIGALSEWLTFANALKVIGGAYLVADAASAVEGTLALLQRVRDRGARVAEAAQAVDASASAWTERGAAPADLLRMLAQRPRSTDEIAALLGCGPSEAEALLWGLGFHHRPDEHVWVHAGDPLAKLLAADVELSFADAVVVLDRKELLEEIVNSRIDEFVANGKAPDPTAAQARLNDTLLDASLPPRRLSPRRLMQRMRRVAWRPR